MTGSASARAVRVLLRRVRRRWFLFEWLRVLAWALAAAALPAAVLALAGRLGRLDGWGLAALVGVVPVAGLAAAATAGWRLRHRPSDRQVARYVEERCPELEDRLATAADVLHAPGRSAFDAPILDDAARHGAALDLDRVVPRAWLWRRAAVAAVTGVVLAAGLGIARGDLERAFWAARLAVWPPALSLSVTPGDATVVEGASLDVAARLTGVPGHVTPGAVTLSRRSPAGDAVAEMLVTGGTAHARIDAIDAPLTYRVTARNLASPDYRVTVRRYARLARIDLAYVFPAFTRLAPRRQEDDGDVLAPVGTRVTVTIHPTQPAASGTLTFADGRAVRLETSADGRLTGTFDVQGEGAYRVALVSADGLSWRDDNEYLVRTIDDLPPEVRVVRPGGDRRVTRLEEVSFEVQADDDHGVAGLELVVAPRGGTPRVIPLLGGAPRSTVAGRHVLYLEEFDLQPGDFVTYFARARDVARGKRSSETRTDIFFLEVRPFSEEFEAAQSQAFAAGGAGNMDDLAEQQKDVVVATWKQQRRGTPRRPTEIAAIARAQATVRGRAEQQASARVPEAAPQRRGRRGEPAPPPVEPPVVLPPGPAPAPGVGGSTPAEGSTGAAPADPMKAAVAAMSRAEAALDRGDLDAAVPHEMDALNQLLRAAAEARRRAIARQQGGGGRGGRSGNQDLSALFDRELQRQQETNYENRATVDTSAGGAAPDPLEQLRELARRQQEVERRERDLARERARLPADEARRRLERLTREQAALQREAERLARYLERQDARQGNGTGSAAEAVRAAAEAMREAGAPSRDGGATAGGGAASGSAAAAAARQRALDRLRDAERRAMGSDPDSRARAAGDRQLGLQELAEAQRRLGRDAASAGSEEAAEEARRLAAQQDRLAARLEALGQGGGQARGRRSEQSVQQLAGAMRGAAERLRGAGTTGGGGGDAASRLRAHGETARDLAAELERAARAVPGAPGDAEARRLSERLARTRDLRAELDRLGRRIEELGRAAAGASSDGAASGAAGSTQRAGRGDRQSAGRGDPQGAARGAGQATGQGTGQATGQAAGQGTGQGSGQGTGQGSGRGTGQDGGRAEIARLQREFARRAAEARQLAGETGGGRTDGGDRGGGTPTGWQPSGSAPGTEAFKQDFARWDALRREVTLALDRVEASVSGMLDSRSARQRLAAGEQDRAPASYRRQVGRYFETLPQQERP